MDDAERRAVVVAKVVRVAEPREDVAHHRHRDVRIDRSPCPPRAAHDAMERLTVEVLHLEAVVLAVEPDLARLHDVRMIQPRADPGLVVEHGDLVAIDCARAQPLDDHQLHEATDAPAHREEHVCHASAAELGDDLRLVHDLPTMNDVRVSGPCRWGSRRGSDP